MRGLCDTPRIVIIRARYGALYVATSGASSWRGGRVARMSFPNTIVATRPDVVAERAPADPGFPRMA